MARRAATVSNTRLDAAPAFALEVKQDRSRQLRDRTLAYATELVNAGSFDATSMAEIAHAAGCSVGALYFRFSSKEALFASVIDVAMKQEMEAITRRADKGRYRGRPLAETVSFCVNDFIGFIKGNAPMIRAMYQRSSGGAEYWRVVQTATFDMVRIWIQAVAEAAGRSNDKAYLRQAGLAFQFVSSTLVYSVLIDSPVRPLSRRELEFWLKEMFLHFIAVEVPAEFEMSPAALPQSKPAPSVMPTSSRRGRGASKSAA